VKGLCDAKLFQDRNPARRKSFPALNGSNKSGDADVKLGLIGGMAAFVKIEDMKHENNSNVLLETPQRLTQPEPEPPGLGIADRESCITFPRPISYPRDFLTGCAGVDYTY